MDGHTIGIMLSKREWKKILEQAEQHGTCAHQYSRIAKDLGMEAAFFSISDISILDQKGESFSLEDDGTVIKNGFVPIPMMIYNPIKYNRKKNIKKMRELSQISGTRVINEHHFIKKKHFFNLLQSCEQLSPFIDLKPHKSEDSFFMYVLLQKDKDGKWKNSAAYVKDQEDKVDLIDEAIAHLFQDPFTAEQVKQQLDFINASIGELIHRYYPGVYEIGVIFGCGEDGSISIESTYPAASVVKDLSKNEQLLLEVISWPIKLACSFMKKESVQHQFAHFMPANSEDRNHPSVTIWARMKEFSDEEKIIQLPRNLITNANLLSMITKFGVNETESKLVITDESLLLQSNSAQAPFEIFVSSPLIKELNIPADLVFQVMITEGRIIIGPTIGLLLGEKNHLYHLDYMKKFTDRLGEYEKFGGMVIAFSTRSINWEERVVHGMIYDPVQKAWRYGSAPIPSSIYRRNFHQNPADVDQLMKLTNNKVFNSHPFNKSDLYHLQNEPEMKNQVPKTKQLNRIDELIDFLKEEQKVILKPAGLSRGRGIFILELKKGKQEKYLVHDYRKKERALYVANGPQRLNEILSELDIYKQPYVYQTYIPLLRVGDRLFDIRVVMQKTHMNQWTCTGIECRVAEAGEELTNIARGGDAMDLEEVIAESGIKLSTVNVYWKILKVCNDFCQMIDKRPGHFAEFGMDIALDENGEPWLLEANVYPSFKGFKKLDYPKYLNIRYQPLYYAVRLQGFEVNEEGAGYEIYHPEKSSF